MVSCDIESPRYDSPDSQVKHAKITVAVKIELIDVKPQHLNLIQYALHTSIGALLLLVSFYIILKHY